MTATLPLPPLSPRLPDAAGVISWIHIGDLHITEAGEQNQLDLIAIVEEINQVFSDSLAFIYLPGDIADQGSAAQYSIVRAALDQLQVPWCSIIGDHDVHEKNFTNIITFMAHEKHYTFQVGRVRFVALNAFDLPDPGSFTLLPAQLDWLEQQLDDAEKQNQSAVLLLHCYPTDLKQRGERLQKLVEGPAVRLIDMGHTHYNELANDGRTLYTATRSTGQIEEGPVAYRTRERAARDQDNAVDAWPERGLLGTHLEPNEKGRKW